MSSEAAAFVKQKGHEREREFAHLIGLDESYKNDKKAKKDVIDFNGDGHSVKGGVVADFPLLAKSHTKRLRLFGDERRGRADFSVLKRLSPRAK